MSPATENQQRVNAALSAARTQGLTLAGIMPPRDTIAGLLGWAEKRGWAPDDAEDPMLLTKPGTRGNWQMIEGVGLLVVDATPSPAPSLMAEPAADPHPWLPAPYRAALEAIQEGADVELVGLRLSPDAPVDVEALRAARWTEGAGGQLWQAPRRVIGAQREWRTVMGLRLLVEHAQEEAAPKRRGGKRQMYPYQEKAVREIVEGWDRGESEAMLISVTGSGKSLMLSNVAARWLQRHENGVVLLLVNRLKLVRQNIAALVEDAGIPRSQIGELMGGVDAPVGVRVLVSTVQSARRAKLPRGPLLVIVDEAHAAGGDQYGELLAVLNPAALLGVTATPMRNKGTPLKDVFRRLVRGLEYTEGFELGRLVPPLWYVPALADIQEARELKKFVRDAKLSAGDFTQRAQLEIVEKARIYGSIVEHIKKLAPERQGFVFCMSKPHAAYEAEKLNDAGLTCAVVDGDTPDEERERIYSAYERGDLRWLATCDVLTEGADFPMCSVIVIARPTTSPVRYVQMVGRGLRAHPGKVDCIVIDHVGAFLSPGLGDLDRFTADYWERRWDKVGAAVSGKGAPDPDAPEWGENAGVSLEEVPRECGCGNTWSGGPVCPACGFALRGARAQAAAQFALDVELQHVKSKKEARTLAGTFSGRVLGATDVMAILQHKDVTQRRDALRTCLSDAQKRSIYAQLHQHAHSKGYKPGWAMVAYKETFGEPAPLEWDYRREVVSAEVKEIIRKKNASSFFRSRKRAA